MEPIPPDEQVALTLRGQAGDTDARDRVILSLIPLLRRFAAYFPFPEDDLVQEGVLRIVRRFHAWERDRGLPITYFGTVARYAMQEWVREQGQPHEELIEVPCEPPPDPPQYRQYLGRLSERQREAIECWLDGNTLEQSGVIMGVSKERVRQLRISAVERLRELMNPGL